VDSEAWLKSNVVEELHDQHLEKRVTPAQRKRAIEAFGKAQDQLENAEHSLRSAKARVEVVTRKLLLTVGKGPVVIGGATWDPSHVRERLVYLRRKA
jgi:hypothetical protein